MQCRPVLFIAVWYRCSVRPCRTTLEPLPTAIETPNYLCLASRFSRVSQTIKAVAVFPLIAISRNAYRLFPNVASILASSDIRYTSHCSYYIYGLGACRPVFLPTAYLYSNMRFAIIASERPLNWPWSEITATVLVGDGHG